MDTPEFLSELKRRKILYRGFLYIVVAWVVIQVADVVIPALNIPDWGISLVVILLSLGFPVALLLAWIVDQPTGKKKRARAPVRKRVDPAQDKAGDTPQSVAVLPFVNMSDDKDNEYFSDGMTEEILNALAKVKDLRVASRTSAFAFKGKVQDVLEIAEELRVDTVVEGSVRKSGNRVRVTAQLISAEDGYHLWSETYDRELEDVFKVQDEIARSVVAALRIELGSEEKQALVEPATQDVEAYTLYLKGRFFFFRYQEDDLNRSLESYRQALEHDPDYGRAYAGIADTMMQLADDWLPPDEAYPAAMDAARKAIALDESLAEAHTALGKVLGWFNWDFDGAELALRRAVASNPKYADAHWGLGSILPPNGQLDEAIEEMRTSLSIDPLAPQFSYFLARFLMFGRYLEEAKEQSKRASELDPTSFRPLLVSGQCNLLEGNNEEALALFQKALEVSGVNTVNSYIARALTALGREDEARTLLEQTGSGEDYVRSEFMASAYASLGEFDRAFEALETAFLDRSAGLIYLHVDPAYDSLREDPRYLDLVKRIGLKSD
jgi:adenylate cyclase